MSPHVVASGFIRRHTFKHHIQQEMMNGKICIYAIYTFLNCHTIPQTSFNVATIGLIIDSFPYNLIYTFEKCKKQLLSKLYLQYYTSTYLY